MHKNESGRFSIKTHRATPRGGVCSIVDEETDTP